MPTTPSALRGAALALALAVAAGPTHAASEDATFDFYVSGIPVGKMSLDTSQTASSYTSRSRIEAAGILGALLTFNYDGVSSGRIAADGSIVPDSFRARSISPGNDRRSSIDWKGGAPASVTVDPPRKHPPDPTKQAGTIDPISAAFAILRDRPADRLCDKTLMVFDGSRVSRLRLDPEQDAGDTITCAGSYARIEGEAHSLSSQREFPFQLVFVKQPNGDGRLQRIQTQTTFGRAVLERRS